MRAIYIAGFAELERELTGEMIALEKRLAVVDAELAKLPGNREKVLRLRYIEGMKWERIAEVISYNERYYRLISKRAGE